MTDPAHNGVDGRMAARIDASAPWTEHIRTMDQALEERNATAAVRAWRNAYAAALGTPGWRGLVEVAAGAPPGGPDPGLGQGSEARARGAHGSAHPISTSPASSTRSGGGLKTWRCVNAARSANTMTPVRS